MLKKTLKHPKACEIRRNAFVARMEEYEEQEKQIVYLDESGFAQDMPRQYGYSPIGSRCYGSHDWHSKGRINVIGAIVNMTFVTLGMFSSSINSDVFYAWLTQDLLPKLTTGAVIVMDNATFHKRSDMLKAITEHGCIAEYLPPYSPDLNPIEKSGHRQSLLEGSCAAQLMSYFLTIWIIANYVDLAIYGGTHAS